jgi:hypothetical protein
VKVHASSVHISQHLQGHHKGCKKMDSLIYCIYSNNHQFPFEKKRFVHHAIVAQTHADFTAKALQGVPQRTKWAIYPGVTAPKQNCGNPWGNQFGKKETAKETRSENNLFSWWVFHIYVSFLEGKWKNDQETHILGFRQPM